MSHRARARRSAVPMLLSVVLVATLVVPAPAAARPGAGSAGSSPGEDRGRVGYELPVGGEVIRPFEPPLTTMGPGHRGADLGARPGSTVRAAAAGEVTFVGAVAGTVWVSIAHVDGVVTSYGPLRAPQVATGQVVGRGAPLAVLAPGGHGHLGGDEGLHWGARRDGRYIDPLSLLDDGLARPSLVGAGAWEGTAHAVEPYAPWAGGRHGGWTVASSPRARTPGFATPPNHHHLVLVAGLGSSSASSTIDAEHLGYDPRSVTALSYAGRHDEGGEEDDPRRDQRPYGPADTWSGVEDAARTLADQLRAQAAREPGRPVDLLGHSLGGVVLLHYLVEHHDPHDPTLPQIGHVVTVASPLHGSHLASIGTGLRDDPLTGPVVGHLQGRWGVGADRVPLDAAVIDELAVGSSRSWELASGWEHALEDGVAGPLGTGTRVLTIAGARDPVVTPDRARQPDTFLHEGAPPDLGLGPDAPPRWGADNGTTAWIDGDQVVDHRVLPGGHGSVLDTEAAREVVWRFLAGQEVVDSPGHLATVVGGGLGDAARVTQQLVSSVGRVTRTGPSARPVDPPPDDGLP